MADYKFTPGDLVQLKSGGPTMTVESVFVSSLDGSITYSCTWFSGAKHNNHRFAEKALQECTEDYE